MSRFRKTKKRLVKKYPGKNKRVLLVTKSDGGVTHKYQLEVIYEFKDILKNLKLPIYLANLIFFLKLFNFYLKKISHKILKNLFLFRFQK